MKQKNSGTISNTTEFWNTTKRPNLNMWGERGSQDIDRRVRKPIQFTTAESSPTLGKEMDMHV